MFYALSWSVIAGLMALWSLAAWVLHAMAVSASNAGAHAGFASGGGDMRLPDWMGPWLPPEVADAVEQVGLSLAPVIDLLLHVAPAIADGVATLTWIVWTIGCALLALPAAALHLLIALQRHLPRLATVH